MEFRDFTNCEIASIVSFAITFNCEEARRLILERFGKEPPPVRTLRDWKARFLETLTAMPRKPVVHCVWKLMLRRCELCVELNGGHFEQNL